MAITLINVTATNAGGPNTFAQSIGQNSPSLTIAPGREFAANSFVHTPLAANTLVDPNSAAWVQHLTTEVAGVNIYQYCPPIYIVGDIPTMQIKGVRAWDPSFDTWGKAPLESQLNAVPIPDYYTPSPGNDMETIIYQPSTKKYWETWGTMKTGNKALNSAGQLVDEWQAAWGGYIPDISVNQGWFDPTLNPYGYSFGAMATGIAMLSTVMTVAEQKAGVINHPLQLALTYTTANVAVPGGGFNKPPAQRSDGWVDPTLGPSASVPEGVCFRFPASLNLNAIPMTPYALMLAKTVQKYGLYIVDTAGGNFMVFRAENPITNYPGGDPYSTGAINADLTGFPWAQLQAVKANLVTA